MKDMISLFTGAGGLDLGLHQAGFEARVAIEVDQDAIRTLRHKSNARWWANTAIFSEPVEKITSRAILRRAGLRKRQAALLSGGPPCQPFSKSAYWRSGDAKRLDDPRSKTLREYLRVLEDTLPEAFLLENVPGVSFRSKDEGLLLIQKEIDGINRRNGTSYSFFAKQLNAVEHGVPQMRERVFLVGHRGGKPFEFPRATHARPNHRGLGAKRQQSTASCHLSQYTCAWDAIGHLSGQDDPDLKPRGKWADLLPSIPEGQNYLFHTKRGGGVELFGWRTRYWSMLLKLAKDHPSWTLTAQPGPAIGPFHWENRRLSAQELAAIQTFPVDYHIEGGVLSAHKQLGNAVPSALAERLGYEIRRQFFGEDIESTPSLIPSRQQPIPAPEQPAPVTKAVYLDLIGDYDAHQGKGKGPGALRRARN